LIFPSRLYNLVAAVAVFVVVVVFIVVVKKLRKFTREIAVELQNKAKAFF